MAHEIQMDSGPAVPPQAKEKAEHGATHVRKAAEDLGSAAGAMADEYRTRGKEYVRANPTKAVFTALGIGFVLGLIFRR